MLEKNKNLYMKLGEGEHSNMKGDDKISHRNVKT